MAELTSIDGTSTWLPRARGRPGRVGGGARTHAAPSRAAGASGRQARAGDGRVHFGGCRRHAETARHGDVWRRSVGSPRSNLSNVSVGTCGRRVGSACSAPLPLSTFAGTDCVRMCVCVSGEPGRLASCCVVCAGARAVWAHGAGGEGGLTAGGMDSRGSPARSRGRRVSRGPGAWRRTMASCGGRECGAARTPDDATGRWPGPGVSRGWQEAAARESRRPRATRGR